MIISLVYWRLKSRCQPMQREEVLSACDAKQLGDGYKGLTYGLLKLILLNALKTLQILLKPKP